MKNLLVGCLSFLLTLCLATGADAKRQNLTIKTGLGQELQVKDGWFGSKKRVVKDGLGDAYVTEKGWFGTGSKKVAVLGNSLETKKGLFSGETTGRTVFGDSLKSHTGILGGKTTTVDLSGSANLIKGLIQTKLKEHTGTAAAPQGLIAPAAPPLSALPDQMSF